MRSVSDWWWTRCHGDDGGYCEDIWVDDNERCGGEKCCISLLMTVEEWGEVAVEMVTWVQRWEGRGFEGDGAHDGKDWRDHSVSGICCWERRGDELARRCRCRWLQVLESNVQSPWSRVQVVFEQQALRDCAECSRVPGGKEPGVGKEKSRLLRTVQPMIVIEDTS